MSKNTNVSNSNSKTQPQARSLLKTKTIQRVGATQKTTNSTTRNSVLLKKQASKDEEKKVLVKPIKPEQNSSTKPPQKVTTHPSTVKPAQRQKSLAGPTKVLQKSEPQKLKPQPIRAKYTPEILKKIQTIKPSKPNLVKDTFHSVTVASPPPKRREITPAFQSLPYNSNDMDNEEVTATKERRRTITLDPDDVVILRKDNKVHENVDAYFGNTVKEKNRNSSIEDIANSSSTQKVIKKDPVAFEINFENKAEIPKKVIPKVKESNKEIKKINIENEAAINVAKTVESDNDNSNDYEDDFESYESDFETGSSSAEANSNQSATENESSSDESSDHANFTEPDHDINHPEEEDDDDSEETQPPITVIHRGEKEAERKLDSGNYDLNSRKDGKIIVTSPNLQQMDSLDTTTANSDQLDSGIGYVNNGNIVSTTYSTTKLLNIPMSKMSKRGFELMRKIQLDTVSYQLFDLKPVNYEYFMKIYGNLNTLQAKTQTNENRLNADTQTDEYQSRSIWTQYPPHFDLKFIKENNHLNQYGNNNCCGEFENEEDDNGLTKSNDVLHRSIKALKLFRRNEMKRNFEFRKQTDYDKLNEFLNKTTLTISGVLNKNSATGKNIIKSKLSFSNGFTKINTNFLNALKVVRIFSNLKFNLVLTVHESVEGVYSNEFKNLVVVWSTSDLEKPIRLLSSWSDISIADICSESSDIIIAGLRDGSVAMWDLRETYSYCSKLDGYLTHFAATQSIVPSFGGEEMKLTDLGAVVDTKSFKAEARAYNLKAFKQIQFVSLNDTGILTIWSLVETGKQDFVLRTLKNSPNMKMEFNSPWARVKLIQSAICDLRDYLEIKNIKIQSKFDKTRSYFENDIFNDETLRELQETHQELKLGLQGLRFISLDTSSNMIYIATNRNFIIACSKTLKTERFRKIYIDESRFLFPTALKLHPNGDFLMVGLSNGSVMALNCNQNRTINKQYQDDDNDLEDSNVVDSPEPDIEIGKSCAIQNIIRNERKSSVEYNGNYETRPRTAIPEFQDYSDSAEQYRLFDQQIILNGSVLRKNLVENIEISNDGRKLYTLSDGDVRIYDFLMENELKGGKETALRGMCLTKSTTGNQNVILLNSKNEVEIHIPKV